MIAAILIMSGNVSFAVLGHIAGEMQATDPTEVKIKRRTSAQLWLVSGVIFTALGIYLK